MRVAAALAALAARCAWCEEDDYDLTYDVEFGTYGYYYDYYEDLYDTWNNTGCRYAAWEDIGLDFYGRFNWTDERIYAAAGNNTFVSTGELEEYILGDLGSSRGQRAPLYDNTMIPTQWLLGDVESTPVFVYPWFELTDFDIDEHKNLLHAVGTLRLMWVDFRLAYAYTPDCEDIYGNQFWWILSPSYHSRIWQSEWYFVHGSAQPATARQRRPSMSSRR